MSRINPIDAEKHQQSNLIANLIRLTNELKLAADTDCPNYGPREALPAVERAYRRGYTQGYWAALEAVKAQGQESAKDWFARRLMPWRTKLKWNRGLPAKPVKWEHPPVTPGRD